MTKCLSHRESREINGNTIRGGNIIPTKGDWKTFWAKNLLKVLLPTETGN